MAGGGSSRKRVLAIASGGGHWEQLMQIRDAFADQEVFYATTMNGLGERADVPNVSVVPDCNRHRPLQATWCAIRICALVLRLRPDAVISTGALPGVIALALGRKLRARTVWVDSIANAEEFSMAGRKARAYADLWLSQWPGVASAAGASYAGSIL